MSNANFDLVAPTPAALNDTNTLTALGGTGSAVMAHDFVYSNQAGGVASVTLNGLTAGNTYTVSCFSVGWEAAGGRLLTFASGTDSRSVDQDQFGNDFGIRVDYTFTAAATTRLITITPQNASFRFHLYGLALRPETAPTTVTNASDSGPGSLRWALANALANPGPDTITFDPSLSGATITLSGTQTGGQLSVTDTGGVTIDATSLPAGLTISGAANGTDPSGHRIFNLSGTGASLTLKGLTLSGGTAYSNTQNLTGGAIYAPTGTTLTLDRCTLSGNTASSTSNGGGAIRCVGTLVMTRCTLSGNISTAAGGGAIFLNNGASGTLTHCTIAGNTAATTGGGISEGTGSLILNYCIVADNTAPSNTNINGTFTGSSNLTSGDPLLAALASNGGPTQTVALLAGSPARDAATGSPSTSDQRGYAIINSTPDIGAYEAQLGPIANATAQEGVATAPISFNVGTVGTLSATSSVPGLVSSFSFGGSGAVRTLIITPVPGQTGSATITVADSLSAETQIFTLTVNLFTPLVVANNSDSGSGSLRQAVLDAADHAGPDTITFAPGFTGPIVLASAISIASDVTIDASNVTNGVKISGNNLTGLFTVNSGKSLTLTGLTLTGGNAASGGAISNSGTLTLTQCTLSANTSSRFGGAIANDGSAALTHCTLALNHSTGTSGGSDGGGAIDNYGNAALTLTGCILAGNTSATADGPDLWMENGPLTASGCLIGDDTSSTLTNGVNNNLVGTSAAPVLALLAPLGNYGGPTQTMPPLAGSPAIDPPGGDTSSPLTTDQRGAGFPRVLDGDGNGTAIVDIGAVELRRTVVTTATDELNTPSSGGNGISLREALRDGADLIVFDATVFTGATNTITLTTALGGKITLAKGVIIDASNVPAGVTISGNNTNRIFTVNSGTTVALRGLTLTDGKADGLGNGGAISNAGTLTLTQCTLSGNHAANGFGGAIFKDNGTLALTNSIVAGNVAGNTASGGGGPDIHNADTITPTGVNFIGDLAESALTASVTILTTAANGLINLALLNNYGGPTQTMPPLAGSPALNAAVGSTVTSDQRGFPLLGPADIGAAESQLGPIAAITINEDTGTGALAFAAGTVGTLSASSSNQTLLPNANITLGGSGAARTVAAAPAADQNGSATITVSDSLSGATQAFVLTVTPVNDAPSFTKGANVNVATISAGAQTIVGWATGISAGPNESGQVLTFTVTNSNNALFSTQPAVNTTTGTLTFTPATNAVGVATVSVSLGDNGGTANGGVNASAVQTFTISVFTQTVTTAADSGAGSLRQAILNLAGTTGADTIVFALGFTGPIVLTAVNGEIVLGSSVTIDASSVPGGVTIDGGPGTNRIFTVNSGQTVSLIGLTLTGGNGAGSQINGAGGAIFNLGTLSMTRCTLSGNTSTASGGAIRNAGQLTLTRCTLSGNSAGNNGGAIYSGSTVTLVHCTVSGNTAAATFNGGGISNVGGTLTLTHSIVAQNTVSAQANGPDIYMSAGTLSRTGVNFIGDLTGTGLTAGATLLTGNAQLAPLGDYGGPTKTRALLPGSTARDAATGSTSTSDQRGFSITDGYPDLGAYEARAAGSVSVFTSYNEYIWESLPTAGNGTTADPLHAATYDYDGDGVTNFNEWLALTSPADATSYLRVTQTTITGNTLNVTFPTVVGRNYSLEATTSLAAPITWSPVANSAFTATTTTKTAAISPITGLTTYFVRVRVGP